MFPLSQTHPWAISQSHRCTISQSRSLTDSQSLDLSSPASGSAALGVRGRTLSDIDPRQSRQLPDRRTAEAEGQGIYGAGLADLFSGQSNEPLRGSAYVILAILLH